MEFFFLIIIIESHMLTEVKNDPTIIALLLDALGRLQHHIPGTDTSIFYTL